MTKSNKIALNHHEWYMSKRLKKSRTSKRRTPYRFTYSSVAAFCMITVPRIDRMARRMRRKMVNLRERKRSWRISRNDFPLATDDPFGSFEELLMDDKKTVSSLLSEIRCRKQGSI